MEGRKGCTYKNHHRRNTRPPHVAPDFLLQRKEGRTEGRKEGRTEGRKDGRKEGRKDGRKEGSKEGERKG